jgi:hypothetical protein
MSNSAPALIDPRLNIFDDSLNYVITVLFPKNKTSTYRACIAIAKQATKYIEFEDDGYLFHYACFGSDVRQLSNALITIKYLDAIKSAQLFAKGRAINETYHIKHILECAISASACNDIKAHCIKIIPSHITQSNIAMPCSYLNTWSFNYGFHKLHPSNIKDQIQAFSVKMNVDICPFLDLNNNFPINSAKNVVKNHQLE